MSEAVFIGTSDAFGAGGRRQSAVLLRGGRGSVLLDCGATTNTGLGALGIERDEIDAIVVSHFHGDHFGGIPLLLLAARYQDRRTHPMHLAGPPELEQRVRALCDAMGHPFSQADWPFPVTFTETPPGARYQIGPVSLTSFETRHQLEANPHGYRVSLGGETIVYSGDTGWFDDLPRLTAGSDLFICECTHYAVDVDFHLNLGKLVEKRDQFDVGGMILTHLGAEMSDQRGSCEFDTADDGLLVKL